MWWVKCHYKNIPASVFPKLVSFLWSFCNNMAADARYLSHAGDVATTHEGICAYSNEVFLPHCIITATQ